MYNVDNSVKIIWQLVSQFVSWDFCRYTSEKSETLSSEVDVLTFLRNMIVERTGKSMSDVTKHEIVAKFVMESKSVRALSRLPCISALSESVKRICPELDEAVYKLMHHLETFVSVLDWNKDPQNREVIESRLEDAVNDFCKEANQILPVPDLLKLLEPVIDSDHHHRHKQPREKKTAVFNKSLFEKVLECLHKENITASEAKIIAVSLYEDKFLEKIILGGDSETETEADSEQFSLSIQSSQPLLSEEICQSSQLQKVMQNLSQTEHVTAEPLHLPPASPDSPGQEGHIELPITCAKPVHSTHSHAVTSLVHSSSDFNDGNLNQSVHKNSGIDLASNIQYLQSDGNESDVEDLELSLQTRLKQKFNLCSRPERHDSDPDTSDCDKEGGFRFLTPTLFREDNQGQQQKRPKTVWLSDSDSNDSSVITTICDSQKNDPSWKSFMQFAEPSPVRPAKKRRTAKPLNASQSNQNNKQSDTNSDKSTGSSLYSRIMSGIASKPAPKQKPKTVQRKSSRKVASGKSQKRFKCQQCSNTFQTQLTLKRHVFLKHPILEDSDCDS